MIHLLVHEARNLQLDNVDTVDPIIEVELFGKKVFTKCLLQKMMNLQNSQKDIIKNNNEDLIQIKFFIHSGYSCKEMGMSYRV